MKACTTCGAVSDRITWMGRGEFLCDPCKDQHNHPPAFVERLFKRRGLWVTKALLKDAHENGSWGERRVDARGNVTTRSMSKREASRVTIPMGR